jgi:hypothetical protein
MARCILAEYVSARAQYRMAVEEYALQLGAEAGSESGSSESLAEETARLRFLKVCARMSALEAESWLDAPL